MSEDKQVGKCFVCSFINSDRVMKVYETENVVAFINPTPAVPGEVLITTKKHYTILDQVPNFVVGELFSVANKISMALFKLLELHGTNILVNNGLAAGQQVQHVLVHVIPRKKGDGLNFEWEKKEASADDLKTAMLKLKQVTDQLVIQEDKGKYIETDEQSNEVEEVEEDSKSGELVEKKEVKDDSNDKPVEEHKNYKEYEIKGNYLIRHLRRMP